jgi:hypothetical protein
LAMAPMGLRLPPIHFCLAICIINLNKHFEVGGLGWRGVGKDPSPGSARSRYLVLIENMLTGVTSESPIGPHHLVRNVACTRFTQVSYTLLKLSMAGVSTLSVLHIGLRAVLLIALLEPSSFLGRGPSSGTTTPAKHNCRREDQQKSHHCRLSNALHFAV